MSVNEVLMIVGYVVCGLVVAIYDRYVWYSRPIAVFTHLMSIIFWPLLLIMRILVKILGFRL